jgi:hypothetical protein
MQLSRPAADPRVYQALVLGSLLIYGLARLDFDLRPSWIVSTLGAALLTQWSCGRLDRRPRFDPWSALISGLSLCLLLRAPRVEVMVAAAAIAIASKFVVRVGDRHLWNPTNLAIVVMLALDLGWVSPAQWGTAAYFGLAVAGAGSFVVTRAARLDVVAAFLASWAALLLGRALWLGDPLAIPLRQLRGGALLIFAFYMISDPKTTPRTRAGRIAFAAVVAAGAFFVQFVLWRQDGLLWALAVCAPLATLGASLPTRAVAAAAWRGRLRPAPIAPSVPAASSRLDPLVPERRPR